MEAAMISLQRLFRLLILLLSGFLFTACDSSDGPSRPPPRPTYKICGTITGAAAGISVRITGPENRTVLTDMTGTFIAEQMPAGHYQVTPVQEGFVFDPVQISVDLVGADVTTLAFVRKTPEEGLSAEVIARIDAIPEANLAANEIILPNGRNLEEYLRSRGLPLPTAGAPGAAVQAGQVATTGPQQRKNDLIALMVASAQDMACGRNNPACTKWDYPADATDPEHLPAQHGMTYVYGGRTPAVRTQPTDGCPQRTHGVDCSGMIINAAAAAGLTAPVSSASQANPDNWVLPEDWKLKMKLVTDGSIQTGDIVAWSGHTGIALNSSHFVSSTGRPGQCIQNINPPRGPRDLTYSAFGQGMPTKVLRLTTTLSGAWDMKIRCTGAATDAAIIRFNINNDQGGAFTANGAGVDYDGTPLSFLLNGNYNQISNTVDATLAFTDGTRSDRFTQTLLEDATGYFPLTKVIDNGGCDASASLVRVQDPSQPVARVAPAGNAGVPASMRLGGPTRR
jgi:hypothetical protein